MRVIRYIGISEERKKREKIELEFYKLSLPVLGEVSKLADIAIDAARKSDDRYEEFSDKHKFFPYFQRTTPATPLLLCMLEFLKDRAFDKHARALGLDLSRWEDRGSIEIKKLAGIHGRDEPELVKVELPSKADLAEAEQAFQELNAACLDDVKVLFQPIEAFNSHARAANEKVIRLHLDIERSKDPVPHAIGWSASCVSLCEQLMRTIFTNPLTKRVLESAGRDLGLWARFGKPPRIRTAFDDTDFILVRRGGKSQRVISVGELADLIAAKK